MICNEESKCLFHCCMCSPQSSEPLSVGRFGLAMEQQASRKSLRALQRQLAFEKEGAVGSNVFRDHSKQLLRSFALLICETQTAPNMAEDCTASSQKAGRPLHAFPSLIHQPLALALHLCSSSGGTSRCSLPSVLCLEHLWA